MSASATGPRSRGSFAFFSAVVLEAGLIAAGIFASLWRPSAQWVERAFSNGYYPRWQQLWSSITPAIPFALGDLVFVLGGLAVVAVVIARIRQARRSRRRRLPARALLDIGAIAAFVAVWFYAGWGWGYDRAPVQTRVAYESARITPAAVERLRARAVAQMNSLAPIAHVRERQLDYAQLRAVWMPVVQRLGDTWTPRPAAAKPALFGVFMDATGTSGFTNPFTLETQIAPDSLWFERPFAQAHEWTHVAGYNREDEANYAAVLACLRDPDPAARYSGWLELFLYLPPLKAYPRSMFVPQVWADFAAMAARNKRHLNVRLSRFSWRVYDRYLKSNHIVSGVQNYDQVTLLAAGVPLDRDGLPVIKHALRAIR